MDDIDITIDIALDKTYPYLSSSVNGLLVEDITKVEGPSKSLLANKYLKDIPIRALQLAPMLGSH